MVDRPIIFSGAMIRALIEGRKSQTRRLAWKPLRLVGDGGFGRVGPMQKPSPWQRVQPGDRLWVRESGYLLREAYEHKPSVGDLYRDAGFEFTADGKITPVRSYDTPIEEWVGECARISRPSIHMPRWASRLTLTVTAVRFERLQEISEEDAGAEGWPFAARSQGVPLRDASPIWWFGNLWNDLHGTDAWDANPEVVAIAFTVARRNIDA